MSNNEPRMTKRQAKWYNIGWRAGKSDSEAAHAHVVARTANYEAQFNLGQHELVVQEKNRLERRVGELQRDLVFANDRITQLTNSVVIIRETKK